MRYKHNGVSCIYIYKTGLCSLSLSLVGYVCKRHRADKTVHKKKCKKTPRKSHFPTPFVVLFLQEFYLLLLCGRDRTAKGEKIINQPPMIFHSRTILNIRLYLNTRWSSCFLQLTKRCALKTKVRKGGPPHHQTY